jgi:hypothetical protein
VDTLAGCEDIGKEAQEAGMEFGACQICLEYGAFGAFGFLKKKRARVQVMGEDTAGDLIGKKFFYGIGSSLRGELLEIGHFPHAEKLDSLKGEGAEKARQGKSGSVKVRYSYLPIKTLSASHAMKVKRNLLL